MILRALAAVALLAASGAGRAESVSVDLELAFVVDASGSIDREEMQLQRQGYADALANPQVLRAIRGGFLGAVAISYIEFAASGCVWQRVAWTKIDGPSSAKAAGARITAAPRERCPGGNAIGEAVAYASESVLGNEFKGARKVIDVSGDGPDTTGLVEDARDAAVANGFTINGLVIERPSMPSLPEYQKFPLTCSGRAKSDAKDFLGKRHDRQDRRLTSGFMAELSSVMFPPEEPATHFEKLLCQEVS